MKLLMENWRTYVNEETLKSEMLELLTNNGIVLSEEQLNEIKWKDLLSKYGTKAAVLAALALPGAPAQAGIGDWFGGGGAESSQEQAAPEEGPSEDGNSFTAKFEVAGDIQLSMQAADSLALEGAADNGLQGAEVTSRMQSGGFIYSTASVN